MRVLIDTNVLIDFLLKREPYYSTAKNVLMICTHENVEGFVAKQQFMIYKDNIYKKKREENKMGLFADMMVGSLIGEAMGRSFAINKWKEELEEAKAAGDVKKIKEIEEKLKNEGEDI